MSRKLTFILIMIVMLIAALLEIALQPLTFVAAQEGEPTQQPQITVSRTEPGQFTSGQTGVLSVFGTNFTEATTVRLVGVGLLQVTFVNSGALTAALTPDIPPGQFGIEISTPGGGTVMSPNTLTVVPPPTAFPTQAPPTIVPTAFPTLEPPTPVPGQPALVARDFAAIPSIIAPGGPVALTFVLVNQGNRTAQGVSVSIDSGGKFVPANGQASATLPDMPPGSSVQVTLNALAAMDAPEGPNTVPITATYRDFEGETYTSTASLSVEVVARDETTQVTLIGYEIAPQPSAPGEHVALSITVTNSGTEVATRVLLRVAGETNVLLAGRQGDSVPLGDIPPGAEVTIELPMIVSPAAEAGPQPQAVTLSYIQDGEAKQTTTSITVEVAQVVKREPIMLLDNYEIVGGGEILRPGDRFTLAMTLRNVGQADAPGVLVTFGTVDSTSTGSGSEGGGPGGSGSGSTGNSGDAFAPLGVGDTLFLGTVAPGESASMEQEFIVNSSVSSGIYSLPITVRYQAADGETEQQNLRASVIVIAPLRVQTSLESPLPESINVGEPYPVALRVENVGSSAFNVSHVDVTAENAEIVEGASRLLSPIKAEEDETITAMLMPSEEGEFSVTFALTYTDDLNREQTLTTSFDGQAVMPPPPPEMPEMPVEAPVAEAEEDNVLGRLLLGFMGLGG